MSFSAARLLPLAALTCTIGCAGEAGPDAAPASDPPVAAAAEATATPHPAEPDETRLANLRQLTHGGENAEAYFSFDGGRLIFQRTLEPTESCDQIYVMATDGSGARRVSTGRGRTTCAYFLPGGDRIVYSSTHEHDASCPAPPDYSMGYVWPLHDFDIYTAEADGTDLSVLFASPGYDAEATVSPAGDRIVFTSTMDGDLELYSMALDGSDVVRLTDSPGYDGGAFYSPDGSRIVYRARHPETPEEVRDYRRLLEQGLIRPDALDIYVMDADGSNRVRLTDNGAANFAPYWHPSGERIVFSSNLHDPESRNFDIYMVDVDGSNLTRVTTHPEFDGFPVFSPDGGRLVFASNRNASVRGETNIFIADWVEAAP